MKRKNIFTGKYEKLSAEDYPWLRDHFLSVFMKGTYKKRSYLEGRWSHISGGGLTQPKVRRRYLAEEGYNGKYQPGSIHIATEDHRFDFMVIGRYYTKNFDYEHYRLRVINLEEGNIRFVS